MKMTTKESLRKDKEYLNEVLELYNRDIFPDYIIGVHLRPNESDKKLRDVLVEVAKEVKEDEKLNIKLAYVNRDDLVFYIKSYGHPFKSRLQDILSYINGKANIIFDKKLGCENNTNFLYGHIFGFRNDISAYKLMLTIYRENNTITKREWVADIAEKENIEITGNLLRDEMKIASITGKGFDSIPLEDLNGYVIDENNEVKVPSFVFEETIKFFEPLKDK